jgi:hypothetical protein
MMLSVCIATIPERRDLFNSLVAHIDGQAGFYGSCEIVSDASPRGTMTIGAKRQKMNEAARGEYVVHVDDDDWVPDDYIPTIIQALSSNPDCVGHYELVEGLGKRPFLAIWTNKASRWLSGPRAHPYGAECVRTPFHKTPIRRSIALQVPFKDMAFGEDEDFSKRLKAARLLRTEVFIPRVLQFYRYQHEDHNTKYGITT